MKDVPRSLTQLLNGVNENSDDNNKAYIIAATTNLYMEALRRIHGRVLLTPADIKAILDMSYTMIVNPPLNEVPFSPTHRERELTTAEEAQLLNAVSSSLPNDRKM